MLCIPCPWKEDMSDISKLFKCCHVKTEHRVTFLQPYFHARAFIKGWKTMFSDATNNFIWFFSYYTYCTAWERWGIEAQENALLIYGPLSEKTLRIPAMWLPETVYISVFFVILPAGLCCLKKSVMGQWGRYQKVISKVTCSCKKSHFIINTIFIMNKH